MEPELHINDLWRVWQWDEKVRSVFTACYPSAFNVFPPSLILSADFVLAVETSCAFFTHVFLHVGYHVVVKPNSPYASLSSFCVVTFPARSVQVLSLLPGRCKP